MRSTTLTREILAAHPQVVCRLRGREDLDLHLPRRSSSVCVFIIKVSPSGNLGRASSSITYESALFRPSTILKLTGLCTVKAISPYLNGETFPTPDILGKLAFRLEAIVLKIVTSVHFRGDTFPLLRVPPMGSVR